MATIEFLTNIKGQTHVAVKHFNQECEQLGGNYARSTVDDNNTDTEVQVCNMHNGHNQLDTILIVECVTCRPGFLEVLKNDGGIIKHTDPNCSSFLFRADKLRDILPQTGEDFFEVFSVEDDMNYDIQIEHCDCE